MTKTLGRLMSSLNSLKIKQSSSNTRIIGVPIYTLGGDKLRTHDNVYHSTPKIYKASSYTRFPGETMKNENDILMLKNITNDLGYTGVGDKPSKSETFFTKTLPKLVEEIQNRTFQEITLDSDSDLQGKVKE